MRLEPLQPVDFLRQDLTVSIEVVLDRRERARLLPLAALRDADRVLLIDDGRVTERRVRTGLRDRQQVEILDGLSADDRVIVGEAPAPGARVRAR